MKIPVDDEGLNKEARRIVNKLKRLRRNPGMTIEEIVAKGIPVGTNGRPLRGKRLQEYRENGFLSYPRIKK